MGVAFVPGVYHLNTSRLGEDENKTGQTVLCRCCCWLDKVLGDIMLQVYVKQLCCSDTPSKPSLLSTTSLGLCSTNHT